jgi:hypothetical protein
MKVKIFIVIILLVLWRTAQGQSFTNLNFEDATIVPDPTSPYYPEAVYASDAIPGWTATGFIGPADVLYNSASLGSTSVSILDINGYPPLWMEHIVFIYMEEAPPLPLRSAKLA